jgi:acyl carrier protein
MSEPEQAGRSIADRIREFVYEQFPLARKRSLSDDDSLLESGIVDSLGILELVNFATQEFGVVISDEDLQPDNFNSIGSLASFVEARRGSGSQS